MDALVGFSAVVIIFLLYVIHGRAAYRNGVADGWGFSRDPGCPGYAKAGEQIARQDPDGYLKFMKELASPYRTKIVPYSTLLPQDVDASLQCPPDLM